MVKRLSVQEKEKRYITKTSKLLEKGYTFDGTFGHTKTEAQARAS
jgi:hypothetical protein